MYTAPIVAAFLFYILYFYRDVFLVKTDEEVRTTVFDAISSIQTPIKGKIPLFTSCYV